MEDRMMALCGAFMRGTDFFYDGMMIGKVKYEQFLREEGEKYESEIVKNNGKLCIVACKGYRGEEMVEKLMVYLMRYVPIRGHGFDENDKWEACGETMNDKVRDGEKEATVEIKDCEQEGVWRSFSKGAVYQFSKVTGDRNSIHLTKKPIVQGLFILKELCKELKPQMIEVKYLAPVYGTEKVLLEVKGNSFQGMSEQRLCFKGSYKK